MQITEMLQVTKWIKHEIEDGQIIAKFDALYSILNANAAANQPAQAFEDQKVELIGAITSININVLSLSQIQALDILHIKPNIGNLDKKKLEDLLVNTLDIAHVAEQVNAMKNEVQGGINHSNQIAAALEPFIDSEELEIEPNKILTRVIFEHDASIDDINKLRDWSSKWFDIGRGFAIANGQTPEDIRVVGGARGSLIIELAILATTAVPIAKAINLTLDSMVKYKDYQLRANEVRRLKGDNPRLEEEFEEDAKRWEQRALDLKKETAEEITEKIKQHLSDYREDNQAELGKAVRTLVDFISKGGDVDCVITEEVEEKEFAEGISEALRLLRADFNHIRDLKETLLLEHKTNDNEEE